MARRAPTITEAHLRGLPGLRRAASAVLLAAQPATVFEALQLPDVGRKTTRQLLDLGLLTDPDGAQGRSLAEAKRGRRRRG